MKNITIIIPHFNSVELLRKLLLSIPSKEDIEVIVVDDKSTMGKEGYQQLKEEKHFEHIIFLENTTDKKGAGVCRNLGLKRAKGKWILFADADDYFTETMYSSISQYFDTDLDVIFFKPLSIFLDTGKEAHRHKNFARRIEKYLYNRNQKSELELRYKFEVPWSKMIQRTFLVQNQIYFEEVLASNDVLFSAKVGFHMRHFHASQDTIYIVTKGSNSLTTDLSEIIFDIRFSEKEKYYQFLQKHLSQQDLNALNISFFDFLLKSRKYGVKKFFLFLKTLLSRRLPILDTRIFNPFFIFRIFIEKKGI